MRPLPVVLSLVLVSAGALAFRGGGGSGGAGSDSTGRTPPPPANTAFACVLLRAGLSGDALAASSVTGEEVPALVAAVNSNYSGQTLDGLDAAYITAKGTRDKLVRKVQSGLGSEQENGSVAAAESALSSAAAARDAYIASLRTAALATVSSEKRALVNTIWVNTGWAFDVQYLSKNRSEADWVKLRDALAAKRIAAQDGEETFDESAQTYLGTIDADQTIAAAKVSRDTNIFDVQTAWNTAATVGH